MPFRLQYGARDKQATPNTNTSTDTHFQICTATTTGDDSMHTQSAAILILTVSHTPRIDIQDRLIMATTICPPVLSNGHSFQSFTAHTQRHTLNRLLRRWLFSLSPSLVVTVNTLTFSWYAIVPRYLYLSLLHPLQWCCWCASSFFPVNSFNKKPLAV